MQRPVVRSREDAICEFLTGDNLKHTLLLHAYMYHLHCAILLNSHNNRMHFQEIGRKCETMNEYEDFMKDFMTEEKAKEEGIAYKVGKFPFAASGKAVAVNHSEGFVKVLVGEKYGEILGAHIIGSDATELIAEYGLGMKLEATVDEIHQTIHAHPTMSEALAEAAAATHGEAIHI